MTGLSARSMRGGAGGGCRQCCRASSSSISAPGHSSHSARTTKLSDSSRRSARRRIPRRSTATSWACGPTRGARGSARPSTSVSSPTPPMKDARRSSPSRRPKIVRRSRSTVDLASWPSPVLARRTEFCSHRTMMVPAKTVFACEDRYQLRRRLNCQRPIEQGAALWYSAAPTMARLAHRLAVSRRDSGAEQRPRAPTASTSEMSAHRAGPGRRDGNRERSEHGRQA
jgi:hypothetical protein